MSSPLYSNVRQNFRDDFHFSLGDKRLSKLGSLAARKEIV